MTFQQELSSWLSPPPITVHPIPTTGSEAPSAPKLAISVFRDQPTILTFLRHCGCPFAEKTFLSFRDAASAHSNIKFIAISHSNESSTQKWVEAIGGAGPVEVLVDSARDIYGHWGLGTSSFWHVLNPRGLWNVYQVGKRTIYGTDPPKVAVGGK